jgi:hypothetical protein
MSKAELVEMLRSAHDYKYTSEAATAIEELEAENERLNAEVAMLRDALRKYSNHNASCRVRYMDQYKLEECTCWLYQTKFDPEHHSTWLQEHDRQVREECAKVCDDVDKSTHPADLADAIRKLNEVK